MRDDHLMRGLDRDLGVLALYEAITRGQDPAIRGGGVALPPVGRTIVFTAHTRPYTLKTKGKVARFIQTYQRERAYAHASGTAQPPQPIDAS